jgi:hypothetical protein
MALPNGAALDLRGGVGETFRCQGYTSDKIIKNGEM